MVLCGRKPRSMSSHLHYLLFSFTFFCNIFSEKISVPLFDFFPPFSLKILLLMFYFSLLKMFFPWPLQSDKIMQFSSWRDLPFFLIVSGLVLSPFYPVFSRTLSYFKKTESLSFFFVFYFLTSFFFRPFFITSCFCSSRFVFTSFTFLFDLLFSWSSSSWTHFSFPSLSLIFLNNKFPFFLQQKLCNFSLFYMHALPPYVLLLFIYLFIYCLFFSLLVVSVYEKHVFDTSALSKAFNLFVRHLLKFVCFCMFVLLSVFFFNFSFFVCLLLCFLDIPLFLFSFLNICFSHVSFFVVLFECISFFFFLKIPLDLIILFLPFLSPFTYSPVFSKTTFFTESCLLSPFFFLIKVLSPSSCFFTSPEKTLSLKICVDSFWNFRSWTLHIHLHQFNIFPFRMSTLPLYSLLLFILYPLVLSVSPCFLVAFTFFAIFNFLFFLVLDCLLNFLFLFSSVPKNDLSVSLFCWTCFTFIFHALYCFSVSWEMVSRFCLNSPLLFSFSSFKHSVSHYSFPVFDVSEKCCFFPTNWRRHLLFFLFLQFFFFSFSVLSFFFFFEKVCVTNPFIFGLFLEFLVNPFSLFTFFSRKNQPRNLHFLFLFSSFSVSHFFFQHFSLFSIITFSFIIFPSFLFVHPFVRFSSFSLLSFLHSFFISPSQCFSFFFSLSHVYSSFFSIAVVAYPLFVITHFSSDSLFWSWSLCFLASSHFFSSSPSLFFFQKKKSNFSVVNFLKTKLVFIFWTLPLSVLNLVCFSSLRRHFSLFVLCFLLLRFFIITFLDHRYFSWFSFINLLSGPLKKNSFCFVGKFKHIILLSMSSLWKYLVSLCFCPKKNL